MRKLLTALLTAALLHSNVSAAAVHLKTTAKLGSAPNTVVIVPTLPLSSVHKGPLTGGILPVLTAHQTPALSIQPSLVELVAGVEKAQRNGGTAENVLNAAFDASAGKGSGSDLTFSGVAESGGGNNLAPSSGKSSFSGGDNEPSRPNPRRRPITKIVIAIAAGVAAIALAVVLIVNSGRKQNALFESSPANSDIVLVEKAQRANDAPTLEALTQAALQRQAALRERIADAKSRGKKTLDDGTPLNEAAAYADFDGLVIARAQLAENGITSIPEERIGLRPKSLFLHRIASAELLTKALGHEGNLALTLDSLDAELKQQWKNDEAVMKQLNAYLSRVPTAGGRMGELAKKAMQEASMFDAGEIRPELEALVAARTKMRARVSAQLEQDPKFRAISKLAENLAKVKHDDVAEAKRHLRAGQNDLDAAAAAYKEALRNDKLAEDNKKVPVTKEVKDNRGNVIDTVTVIEDHSAEYEKKAAEARATAKAKRESAQNNLTNLNAALRELRDDPTLESVNLDAAVPSSVSPYWSNKELDEAVGVIETTRKQLERLDESVDEKLKAAQERKDSLIDKELEAQKERARKGW
jgi:hypothetical protein